MSFKPSLVDGLPDVGYHKIEAASASLLKSGAKSWKHAKYQKDNPIEPTPAMRLGSLTHAHILEPKKAQSIIIAPTGMDFRTKEGKAFKEANPGFITRSEADAMMGMKTSVWANTEAKTLLSLKGRTECSAFAVDEDTALPLKSRFDFVAENEDVIVDVKTTDCARLFEWERTCAKYQYGLQAAFYSDIYARITGREIKVFFFIVVERDAPYECCVYQIGDKSIAKGRKDYVRLLWEYKACVESGIWPGYHSGIKQFDLPAWALSDQPDQDELIYTLH